MANTPISGLPVAAGANGTDEFAANQAGTTRKVTAAQLDSLIITGHEHTGAAGDGASLGPDSIDDRTRKFLVPAMDALYTHGYPVYLTADEAAYGFFGSFQVPQDYVSGMTVTPSIYTTAAAAGNVYMTALEANYGTSGEDWDVHSNAYAGPNWLIAVGQEDRAFGPALSLANASAGDVVQLHISFNRNDGSDDLAATIYIDGWIVSYTADS